MKVIIDTNFMLMPSTLNVDIFSEINRVLDENYGLYVLDRTIDELKDIVKTQSGRHKRAAKLGLSLLKAKKVKIIKTSSVRNVDDLLVSLAEKSKIAVATQDKALKSRLLANNALIITLRQKKYVILK